MKEGRKETRKGNEGGSKRRKKRMLDLRERNEKEYKKLSARGKEKEKE